MSPVFKNFEGLYGDHQHPFSDTFIHHELLEVRSRLYDWDIAEHLHTDLVQIFFFSSGNGVLIAEQRRIALNAPCVVLIPANTLHGFAFESGMVGEVFTQLEQSLEAIFKPIPHILLEVNRFNHFTFDPNTAIFQEIVHTKEKICQELGNDFFAKEVTLQVLVQLLWIYLYRASLTSQTQVPQSDNRTLGYFQAFQKLIKKSAYEVNSVQAYARALNITSVHLNRVCQALVQKSALQVIHHYLFEEAKKYLLNTTYSLSEISYLLNFKDPAYFSRAFKKQTGFSPKDFRKKGKDRG